jgi:hypothetical protein
VQLPVIIIRREIIDEIESTNYPGERSRTGNGRDATENTRKLEAVFRSGIFRIVFGGFRQNPSGNHRKKSGKFQAGILLPYSRYFLRFPAGSCDFSAYFLQDPVAGTITLGSIFLETSLYSQE